MRWFVAAILVCSFTAFAAMDYGRYLPVKDKVSMRDVQDHLLGPSLTPGGTIAEYHSAKGNYQAGLIHLTSNEKAAFLLLDVKKVMSDPKYLPHMGGYAGKKDGKPFYVFAKGPYIAWLSGLDLETADPIARAFAARIP